MPESPQDGSNPLGRAADAVHRLLKTPIRLPGLRGQHVKARASAVARDRPLSGIESLPDIDKPPAPGRVQFRCYDYSPDHHRVTEIDDLLAWLDQPRPDDAEVRWVNVDGLHPWVVNQFKNKYGFHTLAAEDVLHTPQRPKVEPFDNHLFVVLNMLTLRDGALATEQVSVFLFRDTLLTFQERQGDVWEPIRRRIEKEGSRQRKFSTSAYLLYALLDAIIDQCFPILEHYGDTLEEMEATIADNPTPQVLARLHGIKRELVMLRRLLWPTRELLGRLHEDEEEMLTPNARTFMRDVYDHAIQLVDIVETYREMAGGMTDLYLSSVSDRMNEIMKVLTIIGSLFIPITFLAGVYGMNFEHIPELGWKGAYPTFWIACGVVLTAMVTFFWRKGWIGRG